MKEESPIIGPVDPVNISSTEKILYQMKNCICKIKFKNKIATGFFCKIANINLNFLMTNYQVINSKYMNENKIINIFLNDDKEEIKIDLEIERVKYFNKDYDIALIEIKEADKIRDFLELDDNLFNDNEKFYYEEKSIYLLHYIYGKNICVSYGILNKINRNDISYICSIDNGSFGAPILNLESNKVIGIHKHGSIINLNLKYNKGTLLKYPLNLFIQKYNENKNNCIIGEININKNDINKDIQIINTFENVKKKYHDLFKDGKDEYKFMHEKEIKENIEIYINEKIIKFTYSYKFNKEGKYNIKFSFKNNITRTCFLFCDCNSFTYLNLSNFLSKYVIDMKGMFYNCNSLRHLDLSNFDTQSVVNMSGMFSRCNSLINLNLSNFITENVFNMSGMFEICESLTNLNLSNFETKNVTNMRGMFGRCKSLTNLDLSNFNTKNVANIEDMFLGCESLTTLNISSFDTLKITNMNRLFLGCKSLTNLDISNFNTENVSHMENMFNSCSSLTSLNLLNFNTQYIDNMQGMFYNCCSLKDLDLSSFNTQKVKNMQNMFDSCNSLTILNISNFNTQNVTNMKSMFDNCNSLTDLDLSSFNTENVTDMSYMFSYCNSLTNLNLSNFNTKNVSNMKRMFLGCKLLKKKNIITNDDKILENI